MNPLRCLIVDDNSCFRQEMRGLLEEQGSQIRKPCKSRRQPELWSASRPPLG
jgi:hypothetical protein